MILLLLESTTLSILTFGDCDGGMDVCEGEELVVIRGFVDCCEVGMCRVVGEELGTVMMYAIMMS